MNDRENRAERIAQARAKGGYLACLADLTEMNPAHYISVTEPFPEIAVPHFKNETAFYRLVGQAERDGDYRATDFGATIPDVPKGTYVYWLDRYGKGD